ncbi:MAG: amidohydrolase [Tissierellia bacterium]|nr:amidohydrolase [Tissierellia bacterium]
MLDKLFINGNIHTMAKEGETFEALGLREGLIEFVGTNAEADKLVAQEVVDLQGKTMIPGMADSHLHLYAHCQNLTFVDLSEVTSIGEMIEKMRAKAELTPKGQWIKGVNFDQENWAEHRFPTREEMDQISTEHPVIIKRVCLHAVVVNSMALELVGIGRGYKVASGGVVELDEEGLPNGIIREQSTQVFDDAIPDPLSDPKVRDEMLLQVMGDMVANGITNIHTYAAEIWHYKEDIAVYRELEGRGLLPLRVTVCKDELFEPEEIGPEELKDPHRTVQYGAYKIFSDGSMGSRSAALREDYSDDPGNRGFILYTQEELDDIIYRGYAHGLRPAIHAIGDRALDLTLTGIEHAMARGDEEGLTREGRVPFRVIHAQMADRETVARMAKLPLVVDMQPIFLPTDLHWIEERIGERKVASFPLRDMVDAGIILAGGSDCPVETYRPLPGIYAAVTRQDMEGIPREGFVPEQRLTPYEALAMYTKNAPYATGQEEVLGTLEVGKFADLVVLNDDILKVDAAKIKDLQVEQTYLAGRCVYNRG